MRSYKPRRGRPSSIILLSESVRPTQQKDRNSSNRDSASHADQKFEWVSLQRCVCEPSVPEELCTNL
jgi:hypothetical protein